jgi:hypothetical protein
MKAELKLSPKAKNALLYLVFSGKELPIARLKKKFCDELRNARLVKNEARKQANGRSALHLVLQEAAWDAVADGFPEIPRAGRASPQSANASKKAKKTPAKKPPVLNEIETLNEVLSKLSALMHARGLVLADVVSAASQAAELNVSAPSRVLTEDDVTRRILGNYLALGKSWGQEVWLRDLRSALDDIPREQVDGVLRRLAERGQLTPYTVNNPRDRKAADDVAALVLGVTRHHCVRIKEV